MEGYTEFTEELRKKVAEKMGEGYDTGIHPVAKANMGVVDALTIFRKDGKDIASPNFYLLPLFREYREGRELEEIAGNIAAVYHAQAADMEGLIGSLGDITEYESIKDRIYFRLLCTERNGAFLKNVLHFEVLDLSMVIYILVREDENGIGSVPVQNRLLESWRVPAEKVKEQAEKNTPLLFPAKVLPLVSVLAEAFKAAGSTDILMDTVGDSLEKQGHQEAFIMTNAKGINGFCAALYPNVLEDFSNLTKKDLYVLPSSIHEAILLPADSFMEPLELQEMVREVNASMMAEQDILSDNVYYYDRQKKKLSIAGEERK